MQVKLHANATTTPRIRKYIQESDKPVRALARELGIAETTVRVWRERDSVEDRSHTAHNLRTSMPKEYERVVIELRKTLLLSLDDLLVVVRRFLHPEISRSGLDRLLRRYGVSRLRDLLPETTPKPSPKNFKEYDPGYVHVDLKYLPRMADEKKRKYLFVGIDRATRWVYLEILPDKTASSASFFLKNLLKAAPFKVKIILTDNGKEFTDRFCATGQRKPTGNHVFDKECTASHIEHRLIKPMTPQTNGMVERFNGRVADILKRTRFSSSADLSDTMHRYKLIYNQHIAQKALNHVTPMDKLKEYHKTMPHLFHKKPINRRGPDRYGLNSINFSAYLPALMLYASMVISVFDGFMIFLSCSVEDVWEGVVKRTLFLFYCIFELIVLLLYLFCRDCASSDGVWESVSTGAFFR